MSDGTMTSIGNAGFGASIGGGLVGATQLNEQTASLVPYDWAQWGVIIAALGLLTQWVIALLKWWQSRRSEKRHIKALKARIAELEGEVAK